MRIGYNCNIKTGVEAIYRDENCLFPLTTRHVWHLVKKYGRMVGIDAHPHSLRQSYAINMIRNGVDIRRVQLLLGHADIQTTTIYPQFKDRDLRDVYNKVWIVSLRCTFNPHFVEA